MKKIVILGHGIGVKRVIETLLENKKLNSSVIAVITHPFEEHFRDLEMIQTRKSIYGDCAYNVFEVTKDYGIPIYETSDVNDDKTIEIIKSYTPEYIISIGCRDIIKSKFLNIFSGKVFNIHTTPLPRYRGAAGDTWMILNGENNNKLFGCFHIIDTGIDTGGIIAKEYYTIPKNSYPIDVFKIRMSIYPNLIMRAFSILNSENYEIEKQNQDFATTFPRLFTPVDGKIDFINWDGLDIEKFIYAFGYPFEGAYFYFNKIKINVLEAEFTSDLKMHPFSYGLIIGKNNLNQYKISVKNGLILLKKIEIDGNFIDQKLILRLGKKVE